MAAAMAPIMTTAMAIMTIRTDADMPFPLDKLPITTGTDKNRYKPTATVMNDLLSVRSLSFEETVWDAYDAITSSVTGSESEL
jgi:hypothetical protein